MGVLDHWAAHAYGRCMWLCQCACAWVFSRRQLQLDVSLKLRMLAHPNLPPLRTTPPRPLAVYTAANISGGHLNPAVTQSTLLCGFYPVIHSVLYIILQIVGGIFGSLLAAGLLPHAPVAMGPGGPGCFEPYISEDLANTKALTAAQLFGWEVRHPRREGRCLMCQIMVYPLLSPCLLTYFLRHAPPTSSLTTRW